VIENCLITRLPNLLSYPKLIAIAENYPEQLEALASETVKTASERNRLQEQNASVQKALDRFGKTEFLQLIMESNYEVPTMVEESDSALQTWQSVESAGLQVPATPPAKPKQPRERSLSHVSFSSSSSTLADASPLGRRLVGAAGA
jgi:hypothetical protein